VKWYLLLVATLIAAMLGYQVVEMARWTPSVASLGHTFQVEAPAQLGVVRPGGRISSHQPLLLQGHVINCGIEQPCDTVFRGLREDEPIAATLVDVPDGRGGRWIAMRMVRRSNGDSFTNSPERIVSEWRKTAWANMLLSVFALVFFPLVFPALVSPVFRVAWWATVAPQTEPRVVETS